MDGVLHVIDQLGRALRAQEQQVRDLRERIAELERELEERTRD